MFDLCAEMWRAVGGEPSVVVARLTDEEAQQLIAQSERDLKRDIEKMRARVEPTAESWIRLY